MAETTMAQGQAEPEVYLHDWAESGRAGMLEDFGIPESELDGATILLASYTYEFYEGSAFVLFERDGKLYEVNGGHCSCYGLSSSGIMGDPPSQWQPEETTVEAQRQYLSGERYRGDDIRDQLEAVVSKLEAEYAAALKGEASHD